MKKQALLFLIGITAAASAHAQSLGPSTLNSAGGSRVIGAYEFDWSVGEMTMIATDTSAANNIIVTQGILQPFTYTNEGVANATLTRQLNVYPNPASSVVNIDYTSPVEGTLTYRLMDIAGKEIKSSTINVQQGKTATQVNVGNLANATYMLEITADPNGNGAENVSYKIEKRN